MNVETKTLYILYFLVKHTPIIFVLLTTSKAIFSAVYSEFIKTKSRILISSIYQISANLKQKIHRIIGFSQNFYISASLIRVTVKVNKPIQQWLEQS